RDYPRSESLIRRALQQRPVWPQANNMLAYALAEQGKLDEALKTGITAMHQAPEDGNIIDTVAEMCQRRHDWKRAAEFYEQALEREREFEAAETRVKYAQTLFALKRRREAEAQLEPIAAAHLPHWSDRA